METLIVDKSNWRVEVLPDSETLSLRAASIFVSASKNSIATKKRFAVAISGGSTPRRLYVLLGSDAYRHQVDWQHVHLFWVDERCVPKEDEASNFRMAYDPLLSKVALPDKNIHRIKGEEAPDKAARDYEEEMRRFFGESERPRFDLILLGMGEDGHTASLFPGSKSLEETVRLAIPVYLEGPKKNRITLTLPVLNNADQILFLVSGPSKAAVLSEILGDGEKKKRFPAGMIRPARGNPTWLIDREAAGKLPHTPHQEEQK
ncbi:MAG TPA: 6-phosphogluconolactonase [Thermodesulfobacteriota bacterium]|nr:6-phosphogluconolactonase [Thermodesulfobacteriota bacterium]